jgi:hypothetical protein
LARKATRRVRNLVSPGHHQSRACSAGEREGCHLLQKLLWHRKKRLLLLLKGWRVEVAAVVAFLLPRHHLRTLVVS